MQILQVFIKLEKRHPPSACRCEGCRPCTQERQAASSIALLDTTARPRCVSIKGKAWSGMASKPSISCEIRNALGAKIVKLSSILHATATLKGLPHKPCPPPMIMFAIVVDNMALCRHRELNAFSLVVRTAGANINCLLFW